MKQFLLLILLPFCALTSKAQVNLISNGDFESYPWNAWNSTNSSNLWWGNISGCNALSGTKYVWFGDENQSTGVNNATADIYQTVTIPTNTLNCSLYFQCSINTLDSGTAMIYDSLKVCLRSTTGQLLQFWYMPSTTYANGLPGCQTWPTAYAIAIPATYFGQTVRVSFEFQTDGGLPTLFRIDNISMPTTTSPIAATENFSYTAGQLTNLNGGTNVSGGVWTNFSGTTSPLMVAAGNLAYSGYKATNTGSRINLVSAPLVSAEDAYYQFPTKTAGIQYAAMLISVTDTTGLLPNTDVSGDYFAAFMPSASNAIFNARLSIRKGSSGNTYRLGLRPSSSVATTFAAINHTPSSINLVIIGYKMIPGTGNDSCYLWINPALTFPLGTPNVSTVVSSNELTDMAKLGIRQGVSTPNMILDGIMLDTTALNFNVTCAYTLSTPSFTCPTVQATTYNNISSLTTQSTCAWSASVTSGNAWLSCTSSGTGSGNLSITVQANTTTTSRTGTISVGGKTLTIVQPGNNCVSSLGAGYYNCPSAVANTYANIVPVNTSASTGCFWTASVVSGGNWLTSTSTGSTSGNVSITVTANTGASARVGSIAVGKDTLYITQPGTSCTYAVSQSTYNCPTGEATTYNNIATLTTQVGCTWSSAISYGSSWLSCKSSGTGSGTISISVSKNTSTLSRVGVVYVGDKTITINQPASCTLSLAPPHYTCSTSTATTNTPVGTVYTPPGCSWSSSVVSGATWLSATPSGTGNTNIAITVTANTGTNPRMGSIVVGMDTLRVTQPGSCTYNLSRTSYITNSAIAGTYSNIFTVTCASGCVWSADVTQGSSWLSSTSSGTGSGNVSFTVKANPTKEARLGIISIGGKLFAVQQEGNCSHVLSQKNYTCSSSAANTYTNITTVTTVASCPWSANVLSGGGWLSSTSTGTTSGNISISVTGNIGSSARVGTILVGNDTLTITQPGTCSYSLSQSGYTCTSDLANTYTNIVSLTSSAGCSWSAIVTSGSDWLSTTSAGTGSGNISITVKANTSTATRTGTITIGGQELSITQPGQVCSFSFSTPSYTCATASANSYSNIANITPGVNNSSCVWTANVLSGSSWLSTTSSGALSGQLSISVLANTGASSRIGTISVGFDTITITQPGTSCTYTLSQSTYTCASAQATSYSNIAGITTQAGCTWSAVVTSGSSWLSTSSAGIGTGNISITVQANTTSTTRQGTITVGGKVLTITQPGVCGYSVSVSSYTCPSASAATYNNISALTTQAGCSWSASVSSGTWLTTSSSGTGSGNISITVQQNTSVNSRTGTITAGGQVITITQPSSCTYTLSQASYFCAANTATTYSNIATVTTQSGCTWTANVLTGGAWLSSTSSGTATGTISITVQANTGTNSRTGTIVAGDDTLTITQPGTCTFNLSQTTFTCTSPAAGLYPNIVNVSTLAGCTWNAVVTTGGTWLTTTSSGTGTGNISINVTQNTTSSARVGNIAVGGRVIIITQPACPAAPVITVSGNTLTSSETTGNQWIYNYFDIPNATSKTYTPTKSGAYMVKLNIGGCSTVYSTSKFFIMTGVDETLSNTTKVDLFPNPAEDDITIRSELFEKGTYFKITDITGRLILDYTPDLPEIQSKSVNLSIQDLDAGQYILSIHGADGYKQSVSFIKMK